VTLGPDQDTVKYLRELITPVEASGLDFDAVVERLPRPLQSQLRAVREPAKRVLAANPANAEAAIHLKASKLTLVLAFVASGRATVGWVQLDDDWKARRESPPREVVAWPGALDPFYPHGPFSSAAALFGDSIRDPRGLVRHVPRVIEAGIQGEAGRHEGQTPLVGGPVNTVLIDAKGARCAPACSPG
jgi:hypothetical protein